MRGLGQLAYCGGATGAAFGTGGAFDTVGADLAAGAVTPANAWNLLPYFASTERRSAAGSDRRCGVVAQALGWDSVGVGESGGEGVHGLIAKCGD